jgi:inward rectifier potassium channel
MAKGHRRQGRGRLHDALVQFGIPEMVSTDARRYDWRDPYHALLTLRWPVFLAVVLGYYLAVNAAFGLLYLVQPGDVANLRAGDWADAFFFSVETFATVGYGVMAPQTPYAHIIATAEIFLGLLSSAVITGLIFVRFARPRPSVVFSRYLTVAPLDGVPTLMIRLGNRRTSPIVNTEAWLTLFARHETEEGYVLWHARELALVRSRMQSFTLSWTLRHRIDETSPLHGITAEGLLAREAQFVVSIAGTDATLATPVHAMRGYEPGDVLWGYRFADMISEDSAGRTRVELSRLDDVMPT